MTASETRHDPLTGFTFRRPIALRRLASQGDFRPSTISSSSRPSALVAQTFYGTMLKQMRNSPFKSKLFDGGRGGEAFASMFDQHLADRMSRGPAGSW